MTENDTWRGCYGERVSYEELDVFLEDTFRLDDANEKLGSERFSTCVWGHSGIGKTAKIKQFRTRRVEWRGEAYDGYDIRSVPLAQFEEMGDLHGLSDKHVLVKNELGGRLVEKWVPFEVVRGYVDQGFEIDHTSGIRTMYAPPDWVPTSPGPCVIIIDDFNRAGQRIIKGCMQLLQEHGLMSWKLPPGCHIVLTGNPDEQDYFVTTIDPAVLQRLRSCTLKFDAKEWSVWASRSGIDPRVISYVLAYPEMVTSGTTRTSPRSLAEFGRYLSQAGNPNSRRMQIAAHSVLDEQTVASLLTFVDRDYEIIVGPEDIIAGKSFIYDHLKDIMTRKEKRIDVLGVTCDRLFAFLSRPDVSPDSKSVENVQKFLTCKYLEPEMRYVFVDRLNRASENSPKMDKWFLGSRELMKLIMEVV